MYCGNCGTQNFHGGKFCANCGSSLDATPQPATASQPVITASPELKISFATTPGPTPLVTPSAVAPEAPKAASQAYNYQPPPQQYAPPKKRGGLLVGLSLIVLAVVAVGCIVIFNRPNPLIEAVKTCDLKYTDGVDLSDQNKTLTIDTMGDTDYTGASIDDYTCVVEALKTPARITNQIESTTLLDGSETGKADGLSYYWNYSTDNGLFLQISIE
jgi:hypothetical protein